MQRFLNDAAFWRPRHLINSAWMQHVPFAFWLVTTLKPRTIVELGTHAGMSYFAMCQAVADTGLQTKCFAVDTWRGDEHASFYDRSVFDRVNAYNEANYASFSTLIRSTFDDAVGSFAPASVDLLHVDGRHFYDDARHDFETWKSRLAPGAVVMFHDTHAVGRGFGVIRVFAELKKEHPTFEFTHASGLGVLGWGQPLHPVLQALFATSGRLAQETRDQYEALGKALRVSQMFRDNEAEYYPPWRPPFAAAALRFLKRNSLIK